jgi:nucleoid DNA-binding protein
MTKRDLVAKVSDETGLNQAKVVQVVQRALDYIAEAVADGDTVELRNFGVFEVRIRKARIGRNLNRPGIELPIPCRAVGKFKPSQEMRKAVIKLSPGHRSDTQSALRMTESDAGSLASPNP